MDNNNIPYYLDLLEELDSLDTPVSDWEANFLESLLEKCEQNGFTISQKQKDVIDRMKEKYLG